MIRYFDPQPDGALPVRFPSPFAATPHPLAARAIRELLDQLPQLMAGELGGKMFGVLVVRDGSRVGYLRACSGMLGGSWHTPGFVPPLFDECARAAFWPAGEAELAALEARRCELVEGAAALAARRELAALIERHELASRELREVHRGRRAARHAAREAGVDRAALDQQSRADTAERRRLDAGQRDEARGAIASVRELDEAIAALDRSRAERSRQLLRAIHDTYTIANARGERRALAELFDAPPGGAGDCAAPKLLGHAYRCGLVPIALAEVWWGAPPITGGRHAGVCYPACRGKCGPILAHMLGGLDHEPPPVFGDAPIGDDEPRVVFEDEWLAVVAKPAGLLSVPGRSGALRDSVLTRLRARDPRASVVHRLDLDTSGLLLTAKHDATHAALQRLFALREVDKRYIAWLDGDVTGERGVVELPIRVDLDDRPRQLVDRVHGKPAVTEWRVVARSADNRTRVALTPRTGRTHQLRVHAAHALGIGVPIVGDRLYGRAGQRLELHAEALAFVHPHTGRRIELELDAPF